MLSTDHTLHWCWQEHITALLIVVFIYCGWGGGGRGDVGGFETELQTPVEEPATRHDVTNPLKRAAESIQTAF